MFDRLRQFFGISPRGGIASVTLPATGLDMPATGLDMPATGLDMPAEYVVPLSPMHRLERGKRRAAKLKGISFPDINPKPLVADPFTELGDELRRRLGAAPGTRPLAPAPRLKPMRGNKPKKRDR